MKSMNKRVFLSRAIIATLVGTFAFAALAPKAQAASHKNKPTQNTTVQEDKVPNCGPRHNVAQVSALVSPIVLYPDPLLAQILMATTYPTEVVKASRWNNSRETEILSYDIGSLSDKPWAPSVKSLEYFPEVLEMTYNKPNWAAQLGDAFSKNPKLVLDTIQQLRREAVKNHTVEEKHILLGEQVVNGKRYITVSAKEREVRIPYYNPYHIFNGWAYKSYPPAIWFPRGVQDDSGKIVYGDDSYDQGLNLWADIDWAYHATVINNKKYNQFIQDNYGNPSTFSPLSSETGWTYWAFDGSENNARPTTTKFAPDPNRIYPGSSNADNCSPDIVYTADPSRPIPRKANMLDIYFGNTPD